jgi:hypothetical protein
MGAQRDTACHWARWLQASVRGTDVEALLALLALVVDEHIVVPALRIEVRREPEADEGTLTSLKDIAGHKRAMQISMAAASASVSHHIKRRPQNERGGVEGRRGGGGKMTRGVHSTCYAMAGHACLTCDGYGCTTHGLLLRLQRGWCAHVCQGWERTFSVQGGGRHYRSHKHFNM